MRIPSEDTYDDVVLCYLEVRVCLLQLTTEWSVLAGILHSFFVSIFYARAAHLQQPDFLPLLVNDSLVNPFGLDVGAIRKQWDRSRTLVLVDLGSTRDLL